MMKVAVYGSLKIGHHNHGVLGDSRLLGQDVLEGWDMYNLGAFPGIVKGEGAISVEVYEVTPETARRLDALEGYQEDNVANSLYIRHEVMTTYGRTSLYVFNKDLTDVKKVRGVATW